MKNKEIIKTVSRNTFFRMYLTDIGLLHRCNLTEIAIITKCMEFGYIVYDTNEFILTTTRKSEICIALNISMNSLYVAIHKLLKKTVLIKTEKKVYLNPNLFFLGSEIARKEILSLTMKYIITEDER